MDAVRRRTPAALRRRAIALLGMVIATCWAAVPLSGGPPADAAGGIVVTAPTMVVGIVGADVPLPGTVITGFPAGETVRAVLRVDSGELSVPSSSGATVVPTGYPAVGASGAELAFEGSQADVVDTLANLTWTPSTAGDTVLRIDAVSGGAAYDPVGGHFYQVMGDGTPLSWSSALSAADDFTFSGYGGYLAAITSAGENDFLKRVTGTSAWAGGSDAGGWTNLTDAVFRWMAGPETGQAFWTFGCGQGLRGECPDLASPANQRFSNWQDGEPDAAGGAELYQVFNEPAGSGLWKDLPDDGNGLVGHFLVEYGGAGVDPLLHGSATQNLAARVPSTMVLSATPSSLSAGEEVLLEATVSVSGGGGVSPTGTVWFSRGTVPLGVVPLVGNQASLTHRVDVAGKVPIIAKYSGDSVFAATSASLTLDVRMVPQPPATVVSLELEPRVPRAGAGLDLRVTVAPRDAGGAVPDGTVMVTDVVAPPGAPGGETVPLGSGDLVDGVATVHVPVLRPGEHAFSATYLGSPAFASAETVTPLRVAVPRSVPTVALSPPRLQLTYPGGTTLAAVVRLDGASLTPGGTVTFSSPVEGASPGERVWGTAPVVNGVARLAVTLPVGESSLFATYSGDDFLEPGRGVGVAVVDPAPTTTHLTVTPGDPEADGPVVGDPVVLTAEVSSPVGAPTGRVEVGAAGDALCSAELEPVPVSPLPGLLPAPPPGTARARCTAWRVPPGRVVATARYLGDGRHAVSLDEVPLDVDVPADPHLEETVRVTLDAVTGTPAGEGRAQGSGDGLRPFTRVWLGVQSTPTVLASVRVRADGTFSLAGRLPADLPAGAHSVFLTGFTGTDELVLARVPFVVDEVGHVVRPPADDAPGAEDPEELDPPSGPGTPGGDTPDGGGTDPGGDGAGSPAPDAPATGAPGTASPTWGGGTPGGGGAGTDSPAEDTAGDDAAAGDELDPEADAEDGEDTGEAEGTGSGDAPGDEQASDGDAVLMANQGNRNAAARGGRSAGRGRKDLDLPRHDPLMHLENTVSVQVTALVLLVGVGAATGHGTGFGRDSGGYVGTALRKHASRQGRTGRGDRTRTWRWPGTAWFDALGRNLPLRLVPVTPLGARLVHDGAYLRAMTGTGYLLLPTVGALLGGAAALDSGGRAVPPALGITVAVLLLGIVDAASGLVASLVFALGVAVAGGAGSAGAVRLLLGLGLLWFGVPLIAAAVRPFRRDPPGSLSDRWDLAADLVIASLVGAWAAQRMVQALPGLAGVELPIAGSADLVALVALGALVVRVLVEWAASAWFPARLAAVEPETLPGSGRAQQACSVLLRTGVLLFVAVTYVGNRWQLWVGGAVLLVAGLLSVFEGAFPQVTWLHRWLPTTTVRIVFLMVLGAAWSWWVFSQLVEPARAVADGFVLLSVPAVALGLLEVLGREGPSWRLTWFPRIAGVGVVVLGVFLVQSGIAVA